MLLQRMARLCWLLDLCSERLDLGDPNMFLICKEGSETKAVLCKDSCGNGSKRLSSSIIHSSQLGCLLSLPKAERSSAQQDPLSQTPDILWDILGGGPWRRTGTGQWVPARSSLPKPPQGSSASPLA